MRRSTTQDTVKLIDKTDRIVIPCKYDDAYDFSEGLARIKVDGKLGYIDRTGEVVIPCRYDEAWDFKNGFASVSVNRKWGLIDKSGNVIISFKYDNYIFFNDNLARVHKDDGLESGYINENGLEYWEN